MSDLVEALAMASDAVRDASAEAAKQDLDFEFRKELLRLGHALIVAKREAAEMVRRRGLS